MGPGVDDPRIGARISHYLIEERIARGGMGVVYRARDEQLDRPVAFKVIAPELARDEQFRHRFISEARSAAAIDHPNVLPVYEAAEAGGDLFIASRFVPGTDLAALLASEGRLELARALAICGGIAAALDAAHRGGLVHRDVKPANTLLTPAAGGGREHVYLTDFGLTKRIGALTGLTQTGQFVGTLDYAAPEQLRGEPSTASTDIYALACVLYECLSGERPFAEQTPAATMYAHLNKEPPSLSAARPELDRSLVEAVRHGMEKDPEQRPPTAAALIEQARAGGAAATVGDRISAETRPVDPDETVAAPEETVAERAAMRTDEAPAPPPARAAEPAPGGGGVPASLWVVVGVLAAVAAVVAVLLLAGSSDDGRTETETGTASAGDSVELASAAVAATGAVGEAVRGATDRGARPSAGQIDGAERAVADLRASIEAAPPATAGITELDAAAGCLQRASSGIAELDPRLNGARVASAAATEIESEMRCAVRELTAAMATIEQQLRAEDAGEALESVRASRRELEGIGGVLDQLFSDLATEIEQAV